jgi:hypothetical protein
VSPLAVRQYAWIGGLGGGVDSIPVVPIVVKARFLERDLGKIMIHMHKKLCSAAS